MYWMLDPASMGRMVPGPPAPLRRIRARMDSDMATISRPLDSFVMNIYAGDVLKG